MKTGRRKRYLRDVRRRLFAAPDEVERFLNDLDHHFDAAAERGESEAEVIAHLGTPEETAAALMEDIELHFAGFWVRVAAFVTDVGVWALISLPLLLIVCLGVVIGERSGNEAIPIAFAILLGLSATAAAMLYFPLLEGRFGKTPGKHLLGLRVRGEGGGPIGYGAAVLRRLSLYFEILVLDALFVPFTAKKQRAFDLVAKTVVVREPGVHPGASAYLTCLVIVVTPAVLLALVGWWLTALQGG